MRKQLAVLLCVLLLFTVGCGPKTAAPDVSSGVDSSVPISSAENTVTGIYTNSQGLMDLPPTDDGSTDWFYETYDYRKFNQISQTHFGTYKNQVADWIQKYERERRNGTLDKTYPPLVKLVLDLNIPKSVFEDYIKAVNAEITAQPPENLDKYLITQEQINAIYSGDLAEMRKALVGEFGFYGNGNLYSAYWMLNHTAQEILDTGVLYDTLKQRIKTYNNHLSDENETHFKYRVSLTRKYNEYEDLLRNRKQPVVNERGEYVIITSDDGGSDWFYDLYTLRVTHISSSWYNLVGDAAFTSWVESYRQKQQNASEQLYPDVVQFLKDFNITKETCKKVVEQQGEDKHFLSLEDLEVVFTWDRAKINQRFVDEYAIYANGEIYNAFWLLNHRAQDYKTVGIPIDELEEKIKKYFGGTGYGSVYKQMLEQNLQDYKALME